MKDSVSALVYTIVKMRHLPASEWSIPMENEVASFVWRQTKRVSDYLQFPLTLLVFAFNLYSWIRWQKSFAQLEQPRREVQIESWKQSRIGACRDFIQLFENLTTFGWYSSNRETKHDAT